MKKLLVTAFLLSSVAGLAQTGYEIKVSFKPFKNKYIYLGHYFGKTYPIVDSALLNDKGEAVFKGSKKLPGGIYLIGYPNKEGFFEVLIDKQQRFSIEADTATIRNGIKFVNSTDNTLFNAYQQYMAAKGRMIQDKRKQLENASGTDSIKLINEINALDKQVGDYRADLVKKNPDHILSTLLKAMKEPVLTGRLKEPKTKQDSIDAYNFYKAHYWDDVNFWDGRLAYTTFFEEKIDKYFAQLVVPHPDSVIAELDHILAPASANEEMQRFLLVKFINRYLVQKYMWEDAVYVHLYEKYFAQKKYPWLDEKGTKTVVDRYYAVIANIMGKPSADIELPDMNGVTKQLYADTSKFILVAFWDATCGHCKEVLPKIDSFYRAKWKAEGLSVYAVSKQTDGSKQAWIDFVNEKKLHDWTNVFYSKDDDKARIEASIPGYSQLYDVLTFPTLFLLDKDKRIIAKKLSYEQVDEVLDVKLKGGGL